MEIKVKHKYSDTDIVIKADNVNIEERLSETIYELKEDGKNDYTKRKGYDITNVAMSQFAEILDDILYYRSRPFDSSTLIENLVAKLPDGKREEVIKSLCTYWDINNQQ